jgi:hypothetical protein
MTAEVNTLISTSSTHQLLSRVISSLPMNHYMVSNFVLFRNTIYLSTFCHRLHSTYSNPLFVNVSKLCCRISVCGTSLTNLSIAANGQAGTILVPWGVMQRCKRMDVALRIQLYCFHSWSSFSYSDL